MPKPVRLIILALICCLGLSCAIPPSTTLPAVAPPELRPQRMVLHEPWSLLGDSAWCGPDLLTWPAPGWRIADGTLVATPDGSATAVAALGALRIAASAAPLTMRLELELSADPGKRLAGIAWGLPDPMASADSPLQPGRPFLLVGITGGGAPVLKHVACARDIDPIAGRLAPDGEKPPPGPVVLRLHARPSGDNVVAVLSVSDSTGREFARASAWQLDPALLMGHPALLAVGPGGAVRWHKAVVTVDAAERLLDRTIGPLLGAWFHYDGRTLDVTAQCLPIDPLEADDAVLERMHNDTWNPVAKGRPDPETGRIRFHVDQLPAATGWSYRIRLPVRLPDNRHETFYWSGRVPPLPAPGSAIHMAMGPPEAAAAMEALNPHLLVWTAPDEPIVSASGPLGEVSRWRLMTMRDALRHRPSIGIETSVTRYAGVRISLHPSDAEAATLDPEADWQAWLGVQHVIHLAPDMFEKAARGLVEAHADTRFRVAAEPEMPERAYEALATSGTGIGRVTLDMASGRVEQARVSAVDARIANGWPLVRDPWPAAMPAVYSHLPPVRVTGLVAPVVQVIDAESDRPLYSYRAEHPVILPRVPRDGRYRLRIGEPGTPHARVLDDLKPLQPADRIPEPDVLVFDTVPRQEPLP